eukprot:GDKI01019690.1.p1 GENE.GDKI01019690.1~~GDKI01019690.1.p1  ORF type:complete len:253 (+),score=68.32 GDKI01019690.1:351-1109(+)
MDLITGVCVDARTAMWQTVCQCGPDSAMDVFMKRMCRSVGAHTHTLAPDANLESELLACMQEVAFRYRNGTMTHLDAVLERMFCLSLVKNPFITPELTDTLRDKRSHLATRLTAAVEIFCAVVRYRGVASGVSTPPPILWYTHTHTAHFINSNSNDRHIDTLSRAEYVPEIMTHKYAQFACELARMRDSIRAADGTGGAPDSNPDRVRFCHMLSDIENATPQMIRRLGRVLCGPDVFEALRKNHPPTMCICV